MAETEEEIAPRWYDQSPPRNPRSCRTRGCRTRRIGATSWSCFTRHPVDLDAARDEGTPFGRAHGSINAILNCIAPYSAQAALNPGETCEFPAEMEGLGGRCLIFEGYASRSDDMVEDFGLMAIIEVFRSEMDYARKHGGAKLIKRLKHKKHDPYFDMDRRPVA